MNTTDLIKCLLNIYLLFFVPQRKGPSFLYIVYGKPTSLNDFLVMFSASEENPASCGRSFPTSPLSQTAWVGSFAL